MTNNNERNKIMKLINKCNKHIPPKICFYYSYICPRCGSEFYFKTDDIESGHVFKNKNKYITCPNNDCMKKISIKIDSDYSISNAKFITSYKYDSTQQWLFSN